MAMTISGNDGLTFPAGSTQVQAGNYQSMVNRIINGRMEIDQRNAGASITPTNGQYSVDRWACFLSQSSKYSVQQNAGSVTPPDGFRNYLGVTSLASTSLGAGDYFMLDQALEGFNIADLMWGTANAKTITISFWVRSSLTGTFGACLGTYSSGRSYPFTYSISSANTWEQKSVTIAGDTSGTWNTNNSGAMALYFGLGVGSTYSGTAGSWSGSNFYSATGATSVVGTNGATFYITGVDLRVGSYTVVPQDFRAYGTELALCQRYYQLAEGFSGTAGSATVMYSQVQFKTEMRTSPTTSASANIQVTYPGINDYSQSSPNCSIVASRVTTRAVQVSLSNFTGMTTGSPLSHNVGVNNASITLSAEL